MIQWTFYENNTTIAHTSSGTGWNGHIIICGAQDRIEIVYTYTPL